MNKKNSLSRQANITIGLSKPLELSRQYQIRYFFRWMGFTTEVFRQTPWSLFCEIHNPLDIGFAAERKLRS